MIKGGKRVGWGSDIDKSQGHEVHFLELSSICFFAMCAASLYLLVSLFLLYLQPLTCCQVRDIHYSLRFTYQYNSTSPLNLQNNVRQRWLKACSKTCKRVVLLQLSFCPGVFSLRVTYHIVLTFLHDWDDLGKCQLGHAEPNAKSRTLEYTKVQQHFRFFSHFCTEATFGLQWHPLMITNWLTGSTFKI